MQSLKRHWESLVTSSRTTINQSQRDLINLLDKAEIRVTSGVQSYTSAICDVLDNYAKKELWWIIQQAVQKEPLKQL